MLDRSIEVGKNAGFCGGVELCVNKLDELLKKYNDLYCMGDVVHNPEVVKDFKNKGLNIVESIKEVNGDKLVIRAHGAPKEIYEIAKNNNIEIYDLTCPKVLNIRKIVQNYIKEDTYIILIAQKKHPEAIGTISFCGSNSCIIETEEELDDLIMTIKNVKNVVVIAQTTFNEKLFKKYAQIIEEKLDKKINVVIKNTICNATSIRQKEVDNLSKEKDCMIIIGGKKSSNTKKLYEISLKNCENTFLIETQDELELNKIKEFYNIGVTAGASTPKTTIEQVVKKIRKLNKK